MYQNQNQIDLSKFSSIMANHEKETLSNKYSFIPTVKAINAFSEKGWFPVKVQEVRAKEKHLGFQKHLIRFRKEGSMPVLNEIHPEIVLTNSHNGLSSFKIMAGLFRLVCANGLVISDSTFGSISIRHMGYTDKSVHEAIEHIGDTVPIIINRVKDFQEIEMNKDEQEVYAEAAIQIKYSEEELKKRTFNINKLLIPQRNQDKKPTLWATFNTIQEKFIKGGHFEEKTPISYVPTIKQINQTRGVKSINEDIRINKGLWMLTEKMAELKKYN